MYRAIVLGIWRYVPRCGRGRARRLVSGWWQTTSHCLRRKIVQV